MSHENKILANVRRRTRKPDMTVYPREALFRMRAFRQEKWIFTVDDWHPNYNTSGEPSQDGEMVKVSLIHMGRYSKKTKQMEFTGWRVCV